MEDASHYQITRGILQNPQRDEACGWYQQGAMSCAHWLAWRVGWDPATAREKVRVARTLGKLPAIDQALKTGKLSYAKARALTRIAKPEIEAELVAMSSCFLRDRGCRFPGCTNTRFLHGHHLRHWLHGGETSLGHLIAWGARRLCRRRTIAGGFGNPFRVPMSTNQLCTAHHHLVHERGWSVQFDAEGALAFTAADGRALPPEPPREMVDDAVVFLRERAADRGLELGAETNLPEWDGNVVDYDWAVGAMIGMG